MIRIYRLAQLYFEVGEVDRVPACNSLNRVPYYFCYALLSMRTLSISYAGGFIVISCGKVEYDNSS
jgi:hypothetical protein